MFCLIMSLTMSSVTLLLTFALMPVAKTSQFTGGAPTQGVINAPDKPKIPNSFQVEVEGMFKDSNTGVDGTLYFDRPNNIAAMEMLWQNDFVRRIYSFDTNELITIKGYDCQVNSIPDDPGESFFPFTNDPNGKRKILGTPEEALYFTYSASPQVDYHGYIESYMYEGYIDVPMYKKKNCSVIHHFSMPDFETPNCDSRFCDPVLLSISVHCAGVEVEIEDERALVGEVDHLYRFYNFMNAIQDESVFHSPPGVYCDRTNSKSFPSLPMYFSFSYDITKNAVQVNSAGGLKILHKKVWYDGDLQLIRMDGSDDDGFLKDTRIYDFNNEIEYSAFPQVNESDRDDLEPGLSLEQITLLPHEVFPRAIQESQKSPVFVGLRKLHGLEYHVWSAMTQDTEDSPKVVTELYFQTTVSERDGEIIKEAGEQLSFIEKYTYIPDDETDNMELSEVAFVPINNFRKVPRDFSAFDVSRWFDEDEKRAFKIDVTGPVMIAGTKSYSDFLEQLYLEMATLGNLSMKRISKLEISSIDSATNKTTFSGWILESPGNLGYKKKNNESDLNTAFSVLNEIIGVQDVTFVVADARGLMQTFVVNSFREARSRKKYEIKTDGKIRKTYSGGAIAATALTMFVVGVIGGIIGIMALNKRKTQKQRNLNILENPSRGNRRVDLNNFPEIS